MRVSQTRARTWPQHIAYFKKRVTDEKQTGTETEGVGNDDEVWFQGV